MSHQPSKPPSEEDSSSSEANQPTPAAAYARYSSVGLQFCALIAAFVYGGFWLDERYGWAPWGILSGTLLGFVGATVWLYRQVYPSSPSGGTSRSE